MRFKHLKRPQQQETTKTEKTTRPKLAAPEVGSPGQETKKASLPLEWKSLAPFIEAQRARRPDPGYTARFWRRIRPLIERRIHQQELVQEYLRETFWRRWGLRTAAAVMFLALLFGLGNLHKENRTLQVRVETLEEDIRFMRAGM